MASEVEAKSLADLNYLATNPPQYPVNPTDTPRDSLILYISRVPGSRDIILSTFKPQRKNVTGGDVANSLYYVHLDDPLDENLSAPPSRSARESNSPRGSIEGARGVIARKPLPSGAPAIPVPESNEHVITRQPVGTLAAGGQTGLDTGGPGLASLNSVRSNHQRAQSQDAQAYSSGPPEERPLKNPMFRTRRRSQQTQPELPPRPQARQPLQQGSPIMRKPLGPRAPMAPRPPDHEQFDSSVFTQHAAPHEPHDSQGPHSAGHDHSTSSLSFFPKGRVSPNSTPGQAATFSRFALTIIRRNITDGLQWNVGKVSSYETNIPTPEQADANLDHLDLGKPQGISAIDIHLETSGYAKFRGMPTRQHISSAMQPHMNSKSNIEASAFGTAAVSSAESEEGFVRQIVMSYSKSFAANLKHAFRQRGSQSDSGTAFAPEDLAPPRPRHARNSSTNSVSSGESSAPVGEAGNNNDDDDFPLPITQPGPGLKPRGFVFKSPWDGWCEFSTGNAGRSLKCRHKLGPRNAVFNPLVMGQAIRDGQAFSRSRTSSISSAITGSKPVSELRFNLPSSELFGSSKEGNGGHQLYDHLNRLLHPENHSSDEEEYSPMDLSLGREKAGGGNRGKRAKLGKLLVHDEGLKMLDLVVAANVGVWWTTWERMF